MYTAALSLGTFTLPIKIFIVHVCFINEINKQIKLLYYY